MKAVIKVDVPGWQIGKSAHVYFPDTMEKHGICEKQEIVLCEDCKYWQDNNDGYPHIGCKWREDETPDPDDFCSAGERKEGWGE